MYSVVLATMLAAGSTTPAWHHHQSCYSCYSCYSGYSGYSGYSCYSCGGCSCHSYPGYRVFPVFHRSHCHGYSSCSCSCTCTTYVYSSCSSCYYSAPICCGGVVTSPRVIPVPSKTLLPYLDQSPLYNPEVEALKKEVERLKKALEKKSEKIPGPKNEGTSAPVTSRVTVMLPADARLWIETVECPLTSSVRSFNTPALNPHQQYFYNLKVEVVRDGRTVSESQRVTITPGQETRVDFNTSTVVGTASR